MLHVHSSFSPLWGVRTPAEIIDQAVALGWERLALTDRNGLYGLFVFLNSAKEKSIQTVVSAEIQKDEDRALCWVVNDVGYRNLCRILSLRHCDPEFSLPEALARHREGLVIASDVSRVLGCLTRQSRKDLYVEVSPGHAMHRALAEARSRSLPPVATIRAVGFDAADLSVHRALRAVARKTTVFRLGPAEGARDGDLLVSPSRLADFFPHCPDAVTNTGRIADACRWDGPGESIVFPAFRGLSPQRACAELRRRAYDGALRRYGGLSPLVERRLEKELGLIEQKGFASYFLVVEDIVRHSRRTCGRGSAAASLVAYALGITHVDPIRHNLFFERFLNPGRVDPPDIDVDFPWDERDAVLDEVFRSYGPRRVAMVANQTGFRWRGAVREVARAYGISDGEISKAVKNLSHGIDLGSWDGPQRLREGRGGLDGFAPPWPEILGIAARLSLHLRHLSVHCGGVVIVPSDVRDHAPVEVAAKGVPVIQWEKDQAEAAGLVKIDLLGNRSLAVIRDALEAVARNTGEVIDYASLDPSADPPTLALIRRGLTMGCFYVESPATRLLLRRMWGERPYAGWEGKDVFEHLVMASSIIRPAANRFIREFVARMRGCPWEPVHPLLAPVLDETYGIAIYQEQITQIAMALAGFSAQEGDDLRKVMSKKHREKRLADLAERFAAGAARNGVPPGVTGEVWQQILSFGGYSFCKPHSASYALVSLKCAYLRAHHPAEFLAAVLSNQGGYYAPLAYISEARRMGLQVLPPCVNRSCEEYQGEGKQLRVGLMTVKGLSRAGLEAVLEAREKGGRFRDLRDFLGRAGIGREDARTLGRAGCLDALERARNRATILLEIDLFFSSNVERDIHISLFEDQTSRPLFSPRPHAPSRLRKMEWEALGFPVTFHPLDPWRKSIQEIRRRGLPLIPARALDDHAGKRVRTVGWWVTGKIVETARHEPMEFVSFEDTTASYDATFFPDVYRQARRRLSPVRPYVLEGRVEEEFGVATLTVERFGFLDE
jgi:error-prone DNA polymerase